MRFVGLDLLRFIAAFSVVMFHYIAWYTIDKPMSSEVLVMAESITRYGYLGVPLFFMISGFVILASAYNRQPFAFAAARAARLYPLYWCGIVLTTGALIFFSSTEVSLSTVFINATMLQSFVGVSSIDGVYWTLAKELQFYLMIFALMLLKVIQYVRVWLSIWLLSDCCFFIFGEPFFMGWIITPEYSPFFIAGVSIYMLVKHNEGRPYYWSSLLLSLVLGTYSAIREASGFITAPSTLDYTVISGLIVSMYFAFFWLVNKKFSQPISSLLLVMGSLTYPLYLIHNRAGKLIMDSVVDELGAELSVILMTVAMLVTSYFLVLVIEKPVGNLLRRYLLAVSQVFDRRLSNSQV